MSNWVGYAVSVNCGEPLGCYQGTILEADGSTITLTKAFRNGFPYPKSQVTLNAADIKDLRIIEEAHAECAEKTHSTVAVSKSNKKAQRATVCENLQATNTGNQQVNNNGNNNTKATTARSSGAVPVRSKPIDIQATRNNKSNTHSGSFSGMGSGSTPKARSAGSAGGAGGPCGAGGAGGPGGARGELARRRNEACFGDAADPALLDDFDFEGNLALFDKQALWEEMRAAAARPDVVRAADEAARSFRHDENVLGAAAAGAGAGDALWVPDELRAGPDLRTDDGRRVPAVTEAARRLIWNGIMRSGEAVSASAWVLLARAAADVALRLVGGGRRLEARNAHQAPALLAVAAPHAAGAAALAAARLLASHTPNVQVLLVGSEAEAARCAALRRELAALARHGVRVRRRAPPPPAPDLVLLALHDPTDNLTEQQEYEKYAEAVEWVRGARCGVLVLEGGAGAGGGGDAGAGAVRGVVVGGLPPPPPAAGQLFLANVAPPPSVFRELDIVYRPPFGAATVLPLY